MSKQKNYKKTLVACYLGFVTQAISANFTPLLFITFISTYGITLEKIAMIHVGGLLILKKKANLQQWLLNLLI